jgi:YbbR domain-containing protein
VITNLFWLFASLSLAFFVWVIAVTSDAQERRFTSIPIQVEMDDELVIVDQQTRVARVTVRAPQDVLGLLTNEDIVVRADLRGLGPGIHTVPLETIVSRRLAVADTQPQQITIEVEALLSQQVPVVANVVEPVPLNFESSPPVFTESQAMVSGPASLVQRVVAAEAEFDLSNQRETLDTTVRVVPVDVDGDTVLGVTIEPQTVGAVIEIRRRDGLEEVTVSPDIAVNSLPEGYVITSILYEPSTVFVIGSPEELEDIPNTLFTAEIDLTDRTDDFEGEVPVLLPEGLESLSFAGERLVSVSIVIDAQTTNLQLENVPVLAVGLASGQEVAFSPETVSALVTGPQPALADLEPQDIRVTVDVTDLEPGTYDLEAFATIDQSDIQSVSLIPPSIEVTIEAPPTATPAASGP